MNDKQGQALIEAVDGAYQFASNVMIAIIADMAEHGASEARVERMIQTLGELNERSLQPAARHVAEVRTAALLAYCRQVLGRDTPG